MKYIILILIAFNFLYCSEKPQKTVNKKFEMTEEQSKFLDTLQYYTFQYFVKEVNPENGLVKDKSTEDSPSSIAAEGFALPIWAIGVEKKWITREEAAKLTLNLFAFLINSEQSTKVDATGYKGFYYHFLEMDNGRRWRDCELSTIDTAWLFAGIRFAMNYYTNDNLIEKSIRALGDSLTKRLDWDWWTKPESDKDYGGTVTMGWRPENGFTEMSWIGFTEAHYLYILSAGTGYKNIDHAYDVWLRDYNWYAPYPNMEHAVFPPLFAYQWSSCFIDYKNVYDKYMLEKNVDYFENSRRAALSQWQYAIENPKDWKGYDSLTWGLTACEGPADEIPNLDRSIYSGYSERGPSFPFRNSWDDGTIAPTAAIASLPFAPEIVIPTIMNFKEKYGDKGLWGKYGFKDAFNPTLNWFDNDYLGIDQGPIVIMIENFKTGFVWKYCMNDPVIKKGMEKLNLVKLQK